MKKILLAALAALSLSGCTGLLNAVAGPAPAPLAASAIDEQALNVAWEAYDAILTSVDALVSSGHLVPNSPRALRVQRYLIMARDGLNAASVAARAGNATTYREALNQARIAFTSARSAFSES